MTLHAYKAKPFLQKRIFTPLVSLMEGMIFFPWGVREKGDSGTIRVIVDSGLALGLMTSPWPVHSPIFSVGNFSRSLTPSVILGTPFRLCRQFRRVVGPFIAFDRALGKKQQEVTC